MERREDIGKDNTKTADESCPCAANRGCNRGTMRNGLNLTWGEIGGEGGVDFVTASECTAYDTDAIDLGTDALLAVGLAVDVLFEDVTDTFP